MSTTNKLDFRARLTLVAIRTVGYLPLSMARALGAGLGRITWLLQNHICKVTLENLAICYPKMSSSERRKLAKRSVIETGKLATEICVIQHHSFAWLQSKIVATHGEDLVKAEIAKGKGMILLAPHVGNWEVMSLTLPTYGKLTALYQPPKQAYLESVIKRSREKTGATLVPTTRKGVAKLLISLRGGGITAVLPDQNPSRGNGEFAPFFGEPAYTMTTVHGFVQRAQCAVIMGLVKRVRGGFEVYYFEAPKDIYSDDRAKSLAALNQGVEQTIAYCPAQYQWEYKRFKRRPQGAEARYVWKE